MKKTIKEEIAEILKTGERPKNIKKVVIIYSEKERKASLFTRCYHFKVINKKKQKILPLFVDYHPSTAEIEKIKSDPNFSGSDSITKVMMCAQCRSIFAIVE